MISTAVVTREEYERRHAELLAMLAAHAETTRDNHEANTNRLFQILLISIAGLIAGLFGVITAILHIIGK